jgi:hypothetical protein
MPLALLLANWVPDPTPEFGADPKPYVLMMVVGMAVGIMGHLIRSRFVVAVGVGTVFLATFALPLALYLSKT